MLGKVDMNFGGHCRRAPGPQKARGDGWKGLRGEGGGGGEVVGEERRGEEIGGWTGDRWTNRR